MANAEAQPRDKRRIAVVGAGLAGLTAAARISEQGYAVTVLEKSRGAGGRMSTRRAGELRFDHGAQYFTVRDPLFERQVRSWERQGLVLRWRPRIAEIADGTLRDKSDGTARYLGSPGMNGPCRALAARQADCRFGWELRSARFLDSAWLLESTHGDTLECDALVVTAPPEQQRNLLAHRAALEAIREIRLLPAWAVMAVLDQPLFTDWDAAFVNQGPLSWIAGQAARPGRPGAEAWVLHAGPAWSAEHLDADPSRIAEMMLQAAAALPGAGSFRVEHAVAHRWRYALAEQPLDRGALVFPSERLVLAGDWCAGSRVEGAFLSGLEAARGVLSALSGGGGFGRD